ncbi:hypothetical protein BC835DRAFT_742469 [Cytidiella melzeri]|nr:hypothetical protein BC835DRAFT_742469 [Cytidiella melzeri]
MQPVSTSIIQFLARYLVQICFITLENGDHHSTQSNRCKTREDGVLTRRCCRRRSRPTVTRNCRQQVQLIKVKKLIWGPGTYPPPNHHTLKVPFQLALPSNLPATCHHRATDTANQVEVVGEIVYYLELVGIRGTLHSNKRARTSFKVLPPFARDVQLQDRLSYGWSGNWRTVCRHINVSFGNSKSTSCVELKFE